MKKYLSVAIIVLLILSGIGTALAQHAQHKEYSLDRLMYGVLSYGDCYSVRVEHKVIKNAQTNEYLYWYKIANVGSKYLLFQWDVLGKVVGGRHALPLIFEMPSGKSYEFALQSKEAPVWTRGMMNRIFLKPGAASGWEAHLEEMRVTVSTMDFWGAHLACSREGPLPPSSLD